ncbi:MAG: hypothetical protein M3329_09830 [Pseudomonadota bacterium]|nr:hypothetical protein [Pseudomonadota bacterium]
MIPGAGLFYEVTPSFGLLAGVHKGLVPNGPGEGEDADPEESINYEARFRYGKDTARRDHRLLERLLKPARPLHAVGRLSGRTARR